MPVVEVHSLRFDPRPVLHWLGDTGRKYTRGLLPARRTFLHLSLMLCHFHPHWRHIEYLAFLIPAHRYILQ